MGWDGLTRRRSTDDFALSFLTAEKVRAPAFAADAHEAFSRKHTCPSWVSQTRKVTCSMWRRLHRNRLYRLLRSFIYDRTGQKRWTATWTNPNFAAQWELDRLPPISLQQAVEDRWFPVGSSVLDIGCGRGNMSAWLAGQGYSVTGVDFAASAVTRAQADYPPDDYANLRFLVADICQPASNIGRFDCLFDRGCFHTIPKRRCANYAKSVTACTSTGGKFLLLHKAERTSSVRQRADRIDEKIKHFFQSSFDIIRVDPIDMLATAESDPTQTPRQGRAYWMVRR